MFNPNHYILGIVPSITEEALFCSSLKTELPSIQFSERPLFLPLSPSFEISDRTLNYFVKEIEESIAFLHSTRINWGTLRVASSQSEILVAPTSNQLIFTVAKYIRNAIIDSKFVISVHERNFTPEMSFSIPLENHQEEINQRANEILLDFSWYAESVSFLQFTEVGWQEKFFLPFAEQRKERTKSHAILPCI